MANAWVEHVRQYALSNGMRYGDAMKDPQCRASYSGGSAVGGKIKVGKAFKKVGRAFKDAGDEIKDAAIDTKQYLGDTKNRQYGKNIMNYVNNVNKYTQAAVKPLGGVPVIGKAAKVVSSVSQAQTNLANNIYKDVKPKEKTYFLDKYKTGGSVMVETPLQSTIAESEFYQLSKYNPNRQSGGSFNAQGGSFRSHGGSFKSNGRP